MEATSVFVKTLSGREEVRLRSMRLTARERTTLIMVDGKRSIAELCMLTPTPHEVERHLRTFLEAGLIALAEEVTSEAVSEPASEPLYQAAPDEVRSVRKHTPVNVEMEKVCQYIHHVAQETLGSEATAFTDKLARLTDADEMLNLASHLRDVLYRFTDVKEADQFLETVREIAPKT